MDNPPTETTALLAQDHEPRPVIHNDTRKGFRTSFYVTLCIMLITFINVSGDQIMESPNTRIYESVICYRYFERTDPSKIKLGRDVVGPGAIGGVDEMFCKADKVQDELAELNGIMQLFDAFATLILAVPFGWIADRYGRWLLIFLNTTQYALRAIWTQLVTWNWQAFDVHNIWFASAMSVLGGGPSVTSALLFVVVADLNTAADRTTAFLRIGAIIMAANLLMPPLAAWMMQKNPWIPSLIGTALMIIAIPICFCIPETLGFATTHDAKSIASTVTVNSHSSEQTCSSNPDKPSLALRWLRKVQSTIFFLVNDWRIPALIAPFILHNLIGTMNRLLIQYISKRYHVTMSTAVMVLTFRNAAMVCLLLVLPYLSTCLVQAYRLSEPKKDLYLARTSQALGAVCWLGLAISPDLLGTVVALMGSALVPCATLLIRSVIASLVPAHQIAEVYSFATVVDTLGTMVGAPLLAKLFREGMRLGGGWVGLPFLVIGVLSAGFAGLLFTIKSRDGDGRDDDLAEEE